MGIEESKKIASRERRLGTVSHYNDVFKNFKDELLADEPKQRIRTFSQASYDEVIYALKALSRIKNSAVVLHGAAGCLSSALYFQKNREELNWYTTNLNERDTILGGTDKLYDTAIKAYKETGAEIIFIVGSPVIAINNDDISAVIAELSLELDARLVPVYTDAFQSKAAVNGYDIVLHSLLRDVVDENDIKSEKEDFVNIAAVCEDDENLLAVADILTELNVKFQFLPAYADINVIKRSVNARLTIVLNKSEGSLLAKSLSEKCGVPYITPEIPVGLKATGAFITSVAKALDITQKGDELIKKYSGSAKAVLYKNSLKGKRVFLNLNIEKAKSFIDFINELNGEVSGVCVPFVDFEDKKNMRRLEQLPDKTPFIIANGQPFETANILSKEAPDYYITDSSDLAFANITGISYVNIKGLRCYGYDGISKLAELLNKAYPNENEEYGVYKPLWLKRSSGWYVKQEVM